MDLLVLVDSVARLSTVANSRREICSYRPSECRALSLKEGGPNARLDSHLPAWLLRDIITKAVQTRLIEKKTNRRVRQ
jgi:hypothetical protein